MEEIKSLNPGRWYVVTDKDANIVEIKYEDSYREVLGFKSEEEYKQVCENWFESIYPEDRANVDRVFEEVVKKHPEGYDYDVEYRMMTKNGYRWIHDVGHCTRREDGSLERCDGFIFDIQDAVDNRVSLAHNALKLELLEHFNTHVDEDPVEMLKIFAEKIRVLLDCDQVICRDLNETRIMLNSEGIRDTWSVPIEYCRQCEHFNAHHPMYSDGYTKMDNCQEGWRGIPVYHKCPIKSSLTRLLYKNGKVDGYLAIHFVQKYHTFTKIEEDTVETFAHILSLSISRFENRKSAAELDSLKSSVSTIFLLSDYDPIIVVDPETGEYEWFMSLAQDVENNTGMSVKGKDLYKDIGPGSGTVIHKDDQEQFYKFYTKENLLEIIKTGISQETENRWLMAQTNEYRWKYNKVVKMVQSDGSTRLVIGVIDTTEKKKHEEELQSALYLAKQQTYLKQFGEMVNAGLWSLRINDNDEIIKVYWSDEIRRMYGFSNEKDFPNTVEAFTNRIHPDDFDDVVRRLEIAVKNRDTEGFVDDIEMRIKNKDGNYFWYHAVARTEYNNDGTRNLFGIAYDSTKDKLVEEKQVQLEEALEVAKKANKRNELLYSIAGAMHWSFGINKEGQIISATYSDTAKENVVIDESNPYSFLEKIHPEDKEKTLTQFYGAIKDHTGVNHDVSHRVMFKDGTYKWVRSSSRIIFGKDGTAELFGMSVNIDAQIKEQERRTREQEVLNSLRSKEQELRHSEFRAAALAYFTEHETDPESFLNFFAEKLRELVRCDQVIYRDEEGHRYINNAPELGNDYEIDADTCAHCPHSDFRSPLYRSGVTIMEDTSIGVDGVPVNKKCPVKSALTRTVKLDGDVKGYLAIHYILDYHEFTDYEKRTLEDFTNLLSMSLSRYESRRKNAELEQELREKELAEIKMLEENYQRLFALEDNFESLYEVELETGKYTSFVKGDFYQSNVSSKMVAPTEFFSDLRKNVKTIIYKDDQDGLNAILSREYIQNELVKKEHFDYYYRVNTESDPIWFKMRMVYKDKDRKNVIIGVFNANDDIEAEQISKQKELLEEQQAELEKALDLADSASRAKTAFLNNMSHDIRTPMNAILGYTDIAINHSNEKERVDDSLAKIKMAGSHLLSLINDILEMSRIEAGKFEFSFAPVNIKKAVTAIKHMGETLAFAKSIEFVTEYGNLENEYVITDELRINQVIINIISNAIKYTNNGGKVIYRIEQSHSAVGGYGMYKLTVSDNGIGMSEEFQKHVFDSFSRENSSTVAKVEGAGLGLSIVKRIVELAKGRISFESKLGVGTTFVVELPFKVMSQEEVDKYLKETYESDHIDRSALKNKRVLVVEDNELNREITTDILNEVGIDVDTASDGSLAVKMIQEKGIDHYCFVLMDIQMPVMNGYEATKKIRELYPNQKLPIIALSANAFAEDKAASLAAGMDNHVSKPIKINELLDCLAKYI